MEVNLRWTTVLAVASSPDVSGWLLAAMTTGVELSSFERKKELIGKRSVQFASNLRVEGTVNRYLKAVNATQ